ncbi:MAG TPA: TraR/DksA C4-type zinc finger protein [Vicinamibacterales bacterium]|jgi:RNA polymerase-binding transcription factor|nr:TraR/DksA C4-type zinc finger protein [Vicinamibacterales bacterium]
MARSRRAQNIKRLLEQRKRQLTAEMQGMMRTVRHESRSERTADEQDVAESDTRSDIDLAVIQMKAETVARIDAALRRLDQGGHGDCVECGEKISIERLTALPFALRCRDCEESREKAMNGGRVRSSTSWRDSMAGSLD